LAATPAQPNVPKPEAKKLAASRAGWHTAYEAVIGPHTTVNTKIKNGAKKAAKKEEGETQALSKVWCDGNKRLPSSGGRRARRQI
jgi:hypothetical protein